MTAKLSRFPLYPLLIAAYFPLYLMAADKGMIDPSDVIRPLVVYILVALLATAALGRALRDIHRAALWVAMAIIIICGFPVLQQIIDTVSELLIKEFPGIFALAIMVAVAVLIGWRAHPGGNLTRIANVVGAVMVAFPLVTLAQRSIVINTAVAGGQAAEQVDAAFGAVQTGGDRPNIVHIVLDGYSRADVLARYYGFDNSSFLDGLRAMGFAVADGATSPYNQTLHNMTSIFTAANLDGVGGNRTGAQLRDALRARLRGNPVMGTLSRLGYQTAALDIQYDPVRMVQLDRLLDRRVLSNFEIAALRRTVLYRIGVKAGLTREMSVRPETFTKPYEQELTGPYFLYFHLLAPHPPFDVTRKGEKMSLEGVSWSMVDGSHFTKHQPARQELYRHGYVEKLIYTNNGILSAVRRIVGQADRPTIVIIHGDHGGGLHFDHDEPEQSCLQERYSPLLAVYSSDGRLQQALPRDINLTNLYRVVFNTYFGTDMPLLPARSVFTKWDQPEWQQIIEPPALAQNCEQGSAAAVGP